MELLWLRHATIQYSAGIVESLDAASVTGWGRTRSMVAAAGILARHDEIESALALLAGLQDDGGSVSLVRSSADGENRWDMNDSALPAMLADTYRDLYSALVDRLRQQGGVQANHRIVKRQILHLIEAGQLTKARGILADVEAPNADLRLLTAMCDPETDPSWDGLTGFGLAAALRNDLIGTEQALDLGRDLKIGRRDYTDAVFARLLTEGRDGLDRVPLVIGNLYDSTVVASLKTDGPIGLSLCSHYLVHVDSYGVAQVNVIALETYGYLVGGMARILSACQYLFSAT